MTSHRATTIGGPCQNTDLHAVSYNGAMPIHDWSKVSAGTFHAFHGSWISEMQKRLNGGVLPEGFYAQAEQVAGETWPDVLTLHVPPTGSEFPNSGRSAEGEGGIAVALAPPRVALHSEAAEAAILALRRRQLVIRHASGDRIVAHIEIVSPGNKDRQTAVEQLVHKAVSALATGHHLLVLDIVPPTPSAPRGMHGAIWDQLGERYVPPAGKPLSLASYVAGAPFAGSTRCYVEPTSVREPLIDMPLFLDPGHYVNVPLELTYSDAYDGVPKRWRPALEGSE